MKKANFLYKCMSLSGLMMLTLLTSCEKDELNSKELLVFLEGDKASFSNAVTVPFVHTPVEVQGNTMVEVTAYATREVPADIDVTITPDASLVAQYNTKNGTQHLELPASAYRVVNAGKFKIAAGTLQSTPIKVEITNASLLTDPKGYLLPLAITSLDSRDKGVRISTSHRAMFLNITYAYSNIQPTQVPLTGTLLTRTGWVATVSNLTNGAPATNLLDNSNSTVWRSSNSATAAKWIILDMGTVTDVSGFRLSPNYTSTTENPTGIAVAVSNDNITWTENGTWTGTAPAAGTNAAAPDFKGINFIAPIKARYVRFTITTWVSGNRTGLAEIQAY